MSAENERKSVDICVKEFEKWQQQENSDTIFLLEVKIVHVISNFYKIMPLSVTLWFYFDFIHFFSLLIFSLPVMKNMDYPQAYVCEIK